MLDDAGQALYVGKARSLKKRVSSYTKVGKLPVRLQRMVAATAKMEFVVTGTEVEALLLEANYIKKFKPRYNILLRDDKSFPYILMTGDHDFPRIAKHRGAKAIRGNYYGPFAGAHDVNRTIITMQKAFMLRNCTDSYFDGRSRPCLQYHIKRCTSPCVGRVSKEEYASQVDEAKAFLSGKSHAIQEKLAGQMQNASSREEFEEAAMLRDRLKALTSVQARQIINVDGLKDADVIALHRQGERSCIQVFFFRGGQNYGNRAFHMKHDFDQPDEEILSSFIAQFYENKPVPPEVLVSHKPSEGDLLEAALGASAGRKVKINKPSRGMRCELVEFVLRNAKEALEREVAINGESKAALERVAEVLGLEEIPKRIEVYDNSHISGTNMVGAMIVAGPEGFMKNAYRKFNIRKAKASDDYGMMREVMERRFGRALKDDPDRQNGDWPDLVMIDGGKGQLGAAMEVLEYIGVADKLNIVAIAKGPERNAGRETFFMPGGAGFQLERNDPALFFLQSLRDEAHRFAVGAHRTRRKNDISRSPLDEVPGIGPKRKKALLMHFGSAKAVADASLKDLQSASGISAATAEVIYNFFHKG
jgi:excinuclease ABC subunit C